MIANFKIRGFIKIEYDGRLFDLHNNFEFEGFVFNANTNSIQMKWKKRPDDWAKNEQANAIMILHKDIQFLNTGFTYGEMVMDDHTGISDLSFFPSSLRDINDRYLDQESPSDEDDIIYSFTDGRYIRIGCSELVLAI